MVPPTAPVLVVAAALVGALELAEVDELAALVGLAELVELLELADPLVLVALLELLAGADGEQATRSPARLLANATPKTPFALLARRSRRDQAARDAARCAFPEEASMLLDNSPNLD